MKKIKLYGKYGIGNYILVDDDDYERVNKYKWDVWRRKDGYISIKKRAYANGKSQSIGIARFILGMKSGDKLVVDHINGNTFDNRKENLRRCSSTQNAFNRGKRKVTKFKYKGVFKSMCRYKDKIYSYYFARISFNKKIISVKCSSEINAAIKYNELAVKYHGDFARLNVITA